MGAGDITLSTTARQQLVTLQQTRVSVDRTQQRLASGLKVSRVEDDPVVFFSARALGARANDLLTIKDGIASGISTIKAAITALDSIEELITQMRGLALAAKASEPPERQDLANQFNELRDQLDAIAEDASYLGLNLIGSTPGTLDVRLNENDSRVESHLKVVGSTISAHNLGIAQVASSQTITEANYNNGGDEQQALSDWLSLARSGDPSAAGRLISVGGLGPQSSVGKWDSGGTPQIRVSGNSFRMGDVNSANVSTLADALDSYYSGGGVSWDANSDGVGDASYTKSTLGWNINMTVSSGVDSWAGDDFLVQLQKSLDQLDGALSTVRSTASSFGTNIAALQVRSDFTGSLVGALQGGADKLVNADINAEGAALVSLQTRAQLGLSALSFAARAERSVVSLF